MYRPKSWMLLILALFVCPRFSSVEAQWVMAARAARNRIQRMTQRSSSGGYDVAIVLPEATSTAVYDKTLKSLQARSDIQITTTNARNGRIEIEKGYQVVRFQINTPSREKSVVRGRASNWELAAGRRVDKFLAIDRDW
jgi:hypothetical protein